ncbi:hypothetical protein J4727_18625 [Providencia rettgeri]|uniref:Uncharacterized protein n=1 Tax=Providencia rettgeri TaxID=587 RepID=A0A939SLZ7_PRORE|nr:hypothetical protein [Providencia rettgeri]
MWISWQASRESLINSLPESITAVPELIWLQVDPEPEEINKPVYPVNLYSGDGVRAGSSQLTPYMFGLIFTQSVKQC